MTQDQVVNVRGHNAVVPAAGGLGTAPLSGGFNMGQVVFITAEHTQNIFTCEAFQGSSDAVDRVAADDYFKIPENCFTQTGQEPAPDEVQLK